MKGKILVCLFMAVLLLGCAQMSAEEIVEKVQEESRSMDSMKGTATAVRYSDGKKDSSKLKFWRENSSYRYSIGNDTKVYNGSVLWKYNGDRNKVHVFNVKQMNATKYASQVGFTSVWAINIGDELNSSATEVNLLGSEKISGRVCYVLNVTRQDTSKKVWIDKEYWYPLKVYQDFDEHNETMVFRVEFNTDIDDSKFNFTPPEDAKVVKYNQSKHAKYI